MYKNAMIKVLSDHNIGSESEREELATRFQKCVEIYPAHKLQVHNFIIIYGVHILQKKAPFHSEKIEHHISEGTENGFVWGISQKEHTRLTYKLEKIEQEAISIAAKLNMNIDYYPDFSHIKRVLGGEIINNKSDVKKMFDASDNYCDQYISYYATFGEYGVVVK